MPTSDQIDGASAAFTGEAPVIANFSPASSLPASLKQRSTILVHQKSPLLIATPPQITRALAYAYPFLSPLNRLTGLLSWTTGDPWESFLLLASFWALTIYGDTILRLAGPTIVAIGLMVGMYTRRFSALSSTGWSPEKTTPSHARKESDSTVRHQKSLDEIVETLRVFTSRCNILLDPFLRMTDFLSTQQTATSATTRPALIALFLRLLLVTPFWCILTLSPFYIITTNRLVLALGTIILTWHSRPARVSRIILWRSTLVRTTCSLITGLYFTDDTSNKKHFSSLKHSNSANDIAAALAARRLGSDKTDTITKPEAIRFTFSVFENQRRWLGIGWTSSMLAYERAAWTDEQLNTTESKDQFSLPTVEGGIARWEWCDDSTWTLEATDAEISVKNRPTGFNTSDDAWVYYDNKWQDGRRGLDGWGKYTRRRRWARDAELIELPTRETSLETLRPSEASSLTDGESVAGMPRSVGDSTPTREHARKKSWFRRARHDSKSSGVSGMTADSEDGAFSFAVDEKESVVGIRDDSDDGYVPMPFRGRQGTLETRWGVGDDIGMELG